MAGQQDPQQAPGQALFAQLDDSIASYESAECFSCGGSLPLSSALDYGDFTSGKKPVACPQPVIFWRTGNMAKSTTIDRTLSATRGWENSLEELIQDCSPATFGRDGKNVFDESVRKAGALGAHSVSTNFSPYDFGIIDAAARELRPGIVRAGKEPAFERWGIVAELPVKRVLGAVRHLQVPRGYASRANTLWVACHCLAHQIPR
jgi:hypothetical protein